ncbi:MAG: CrcB family protein [Pseudoclavibacter sp.]
MRDARRMTLLGSAAVIAVGGTVGTMARIGMEQAFPKSTGWPVTTLSINLAGAFLLGLLTEGLARSGADLGWRKVLRLGLGTGVMGGFTTYGTFILEADSYLRSGLDLQGVSYLLVSVVLGLVAAGLGTLVAHVVPLASADAGEPMS